MSSPDPIPHLFRTEYRKMVSVLCGTLGIGNLQAAEDIVSDTFLTAAETWGLKGLPENPTAWLYRVAKNRAIDLLRRDRLFDSKIAPGLKEGDERYEIDWSEKNIDDSQLRMMFAVCHPSIPVEAQIGLALSILCGFGAEEIADAFLVKRDAIYKRLLRARDKLRKERVSLDFPAPKELRVRLDSVLTTIYLLFNEGYYSASKNTSLRKDLCAEAMRLAYLLTGYPETDHPDVNALIALMCFHASRFEARTGAKGEIILYEEQDESLWDRELVKMGEKYLNKAAIEGQRLSKYHLEAAIAWYHTSKDDSQEKWEQVLQLHNKLLLVEYSPVAALNRTWALSKANGVEEAIREAEKLGLNDNHLYFSLLGKLNRDLDPLKARDHWETAWRLAKSAADRAVILGYLAKLPASE